MRRLVWPRPEGTNSIETGVSRSALCWLAIRESAVEATQLLTERIKEFWHLSPPQRLIFTGQNIVGLVLVDLRVERHLVQEAVHLKDINQGDSKKELR